LIDEGGEGLLVAGGAVDRLADYLRTTVSNGRR
jgi:hypothetical protein